MTFAFTIAASLLSYGALNQRNNRTAQDVDELKRDHGAQIKDVRAATEQAAKDLADYKEKAREKFVINDDLIKLERSLSQQIQTSQTEMSRKVEELRVEFGRRGIEHTIKNAITTSLAAAMVEIKRDRAS